MKKPLTPPKFETLIALAEDQDMNSILRFLSDSNSLDATGNPYYHWDKLRHLTPPQQFTTEYWWRCIKQKRRSAYRRLPTADSEGSSFQYILTDHFSKILHELDTQLAGSIHSIEQITNTNTRDSYLLRSLIEESITSSQLEGASTTTRVAKEMLRSGRKPQTQSERMIFNNYQAMQIVRKNKNNDLSPEVVIEIQRILTEGAIQDEGDSGVLRTTDDILIVDEIGQSLYVPPPHSLVKKRLTDLCLFANQRDFTPFLHPVLQSILVHFMLAFDHPFNDGNGRTARALFYWSMTRNGYWMAEYISISSILRKAPSKYARSYLFTETDDNDMTYFFDHQLSVLVRAVASLFEHLRKKNLELQEARELLSGGLRKRLNHRQTDLLTHALKNPGSQYTIKAHGKTNAVSYRTARQDLLVLAELDLFEQFKVGKELNFQARRDLRQLLESLSKSSN